MKQSILIVIAACVLGFCVAVPVEAQEVQCLGCALSPYTYNSYCLTTNGSWPNCRNLCDGYYCSCQRDSGARCRRGADGTFNGFRVQDVFFLPTDRPFHTAYRITRARMTHRPA